MEATIPPPLRRLAGARAGAKPKHAALSEAMLAAVADGHWRPGDRLPTEAELARALPFSLGTVQKALRRLADDGVVVRRQRAGTFVADTARPGLDDPWHCRFLDDAGAVLPVRPTIVARVHTHEAGPWSAHLGRAPTGFARIDRVLDVNGEFAVHSAFFLDAARFPSFLRRPVAELDGANFKHLLARELRVPAIRFAHELAVAPLQRAVCAALALPERSVGAVLDIAARSPSGEAIYFQRLSIPPNPRRLVVADGPAPCASPRARGAR